MLKAKATKQRRMGLEGTEERAINLGTRMNEQLLVAARHIKLENTIIITISIKL